MFKVVFEVVFKVFRHVPYQGDRQSRNVLYDHTEPLLMVSLVAFCFR